MKNEAELWGAAKHLLLPYEGLASQLYVLDLPLTKLGAVVDQFCDTVSEARAVTIGGDTGSGVPVTGEVREKLISYSEVPNHHHHQLAGGWAPGKHLELFLWIDPTLTVFDAELVFWADLLFPDPADEPACMKAFSACVSLAEAFRVENPRSECVLSASETGDPRDDRDKPWTLFW